MGDTASSIQALISDLHWQVDQLGPRGIKNAAGNPYNPSYYKRGLQNAVNRGGVAVADFVGTYLTKKPSDGYRKLEDADSLDLACEALVADGEKPYAHLFTEDQRRLAQARLAHHLEAIELRRAQQRDRIDRFRAELPDDVEELRGLAAGAERPEESIAINLKILAQTPEDVVALNRLGRGYEATGAKDDAMVAFERVLALDPGNPVASRRVGDLLRKR